MSEGERRLAAIMFTDMVGYTALGQRSESLSLAMVEEQRKIIRPILARHNGREIKTMGDAFLTEFPSALEAVRCAYDIQRSIREFNLPLEPNKRIRLRVGVHVGEVVDSNGDINGDAVNVASRIEPLADAGGVCVSRQVFDHVQNKIDLPLSSLGPKQLKNVIAPIEVFKMAMPWEEADSPGPTWLDRTRVAVIPFANISPDPNDEYFADGLTEELISNLSTVKGLKVVSRTSVMGYKGSKKRLGEIGKELAVGSLIEGSVRKAGTRVRITVQLIDANADEHIWAEKYDRNLDDIFSIQSEVSENVARALSVKLAKYEKERISRQKTKDMGAYQDYLLGRHLLLQGTDESIKKSVELFKRAVAADSAFAEAYSGLADSYELMGHNNITPWGESIRQSLDAVKKALVVDPELAGAHATLGFLTLNNDWNLIDAEKEFRKAIDLDPSGSAAHRQYARCLAALGRLDEACAHAKTAREMDPLMPVSYSDEGLMYFLNGREDEAFDIWAKGQALFPDYDRLHFFPTLARLARGEYADARWELSRASPEYVKGSHGMYLEGMICGYIGRRDDALRIAAKLESQVREGRSAGDLLASIYVATQDYDRFFKLASEAVRLRHWELFVLKNHDKFYPRLSGDIRWAPLLAEAGLT